MQTALGETPRRWHHRANWVKKWDKKREEENLGNGLPEEYSHLRGGEGGDMPVTIYERELHQIEDNREEVAPGKVDSNWEKEGKGGKKPYSRELPETKKESTEKARSTAAAKEMNTASGSVEEENHGLTGGRKDVYYSRYRINLF